MLEVRRMIASYLISMFVQRLPNNAPLAAKLYTSRVKNRDLKNFCSDVAGAETSEEARQTGRWKYCGFVAEFSSVREFNSLYWLMMVRWGELVNGTEEKNWYGPNVPKCVSFWVYFDLPQIWDLGRGSICIIIYGFVIYEISFCACFRIFQSQVSEFIVLFSFTRLLSFKIPCFFFVRIKTCFSVLVVRN